MKIKCGTIGCGAIAELVHLPAYKEIPKVELTAICDINEKKVKYLAKNFNVKEWYTDYTRFLKNANVDAVSICSPNYLHCEQSIAAAEAGKHILIEKPMATTLKECDEIIRACKKNNVKLMVGANPRFETANQIAKEALDKGLIGDIFQIRHHLATGGPYKGWPAVSQWFFDKTKVGGGCVIDQGSHSFDLLRWFAGDISSVFGIGGTLQKGIKGEDNAIILVTFKHGTLGEIDLSWAYKGREISTEILGNGGGIFIRGPISPISICTEKTRGPIHLQLTKTTTERVAYQKKKVKHFIDSIILNKQPTPSGEDGKAVLDAILATYQSMRTGKRVYLRR